MARRRKIHGKRRKKSPLNNVTAKTGILAALSNGAIGGKKDDASDKTKEKPLANQGGDYITRAEASKMIKTGVFKGTKQKPKENKLSEGGSEISKMSAQFGHRGFKR